jgi:hypothetical protein
VTIEGKGMRGKTWLKIIAIGAVICASAVMGGRFFLNELNKGKCHPWAMNITSDISSYIERYGQFPKSQQELIDSKVLTEGDLESLALFEIRYGTREDDLYVKGDNLYDKHTGKRVLLISGPYEEELESLYAHLSVQLYELIVREKEERGNPDEPGSVRK